MQWPKHYGRMYVGCKICASTMIVRSYEIRSSGPSFNSYVISAGTSVPESVELIKSLGATPSGIVIPLDCMERGMVEHSAVREMQPCMLLR